MSDLAQDIIVYNGLSNVCINPCFYILFIIVLLISYDCARSLQETFFIVSFGIKLSNK